MSTVDTAPAKALFVFYDENRLRGKYELSPSLYKFPSTLQSVELYLDSRPVSTFRSLKCDSYRNNLESFSFLQLFKTMEVYYEAQGLDITMEQFLSELFVMAWDCRTAEDKTSGTSLPLLKSGDLKILLRFSEPLAASLSVLLYSWSPALICIAGDGKATVSYRA